MRVFIRPPHRERMFCLQAICKSEYGLRETCCGLDYISEKFLINTFWKTVDPERQCLLDLFHLFSCNNYSGHLLFANLIMRVLFRLSHLVNVRKKNTVLLV